MKPKQCMLALNTANGHICVQQHFNSIASAKRFAKESGCFSYRIFVNGKLVRRGFCD